MVRKRIYKNPLTKPKLDLLICLMIFCKLYNAKSYLHKSCKNQAFSTIVIFKNTAIAYLKDIPSSHGLRGQH